MKDSPADYPHTTEVNGYHMKYSCVGKGPKEIVFLHGVNSDWETWNNVIPRLTFPARCWALTFPKYGSHKVESYSEIIQAFLDKYEIKNPLIVGYSMGALVTLHMLSQGRKFEKIIFASPPITLKKAKIIGRLVAFWRMLLRTNSIVKKVSHFILSSKLNENFLAEASVESYIECWHDIMNLKLPLDYSLIKITSPLLIIYSKFDPFLRMCNGPQFFHLLKPQKIISIKSTSHFIPFENYERLAKAINSFFKD